MNSTIQWQALMISDPWTNLAKAYTAKHIVTQPTIDGKIYKNAPWFLVDGVAHNRLTTFMTH